MEVAYARWESVRAAVRAAGLPMHPPPPDYDDFVEEVLRAGSAAVARLVPADVRGPVSPLALARIAGHGWVFGEELQWQLCSERRQDVSDAVVLLNFMLSFVDDVLDGNPLAAAQLLSVLDRDGLAAALDVERPKPLSAHPDMDEHVALALVVTDELLRRCRALAGRHWAVFSATVLAAYDAERATAASGPAVAAEKNRLSGALAGAVVLLSPVLRPDVDPDAVIELTGAVGATIGLVDDLCDLPTDLERGHANELAHDDIGAAVAELARRLADVRTAAKVVARDPERLERIVAMLVAGWFLTVDEIAAPALVTLLSAE